MSDIVRKNFSLQPEQWERWEKEMEEREFTTESAFVRAMVEAGLKKFERPVNPDENTADLREHRNDLKRELDRSRERISRLEENLNYTDHGAVLSYLQEQPAADFEELLGFIRDTAPQRLTRFLDTVERTDDGEIDTESMERYWAAHELSTALADYAESERRRIEDDETEGER